MKAESLIDATPPFEGKLVGGKTASSETYSLSEKQMTEIMPTTEYTRRTDVETLIKRPY